MPCNRASAAAGIMVILVMLSLPLSTSGAKLNVPRVLLPYSEEGVDFVLESDEPGGCFKWRSTRPESVLVTPLDEDPGRGCSPRALVSPAKSGSVGAKAQSVVTAEDVNSAGHVLRCDVIVDAIHSLQIVTKTHELFLEEAPEEFYVRAYDDQGNEFTTVQKMVFKWTFENMVKRSSAADHNIRFILFRDSTYAYEDSLRDIEAAGGQGRKVLLEGIKTGSSRVYVRLVSSLYSTRVPAADVAVMVVANLYLVPGSAYIMQGGTMAYRAEQIKSNKVHEIALPSHQYYLTVEDSKLASLDAEAAEVTGLDLGSTEVTLKDANVAQDDQSVRPPAGDLHIVTPAYITINVNPYKNWNVIVGETYDLVVDIFDKDNNLIFPSDNVVIEFHVEKNFFNVMWRSNNNTLHKGTPMMAGETEVTATLLGVTDTKTGHLLKLDQPLHATERMTIYDKISLIPQLSIFPWDPFSNPVYSIKYEIQGSSPEVIHQWHSTNVSVATVTQNGVARTGQAEKASSSGVIGETVVTAAMRRASHNRGRASILVLPVGGVALLDGALEAEVGTDLPLPVSLLGTHQGRDVRFTQCHKLTLDLAINDAKIFEEGGPQMDKDSMSSSSVAITEDACTALVLRAKAPGFSTVEVSYSGSGSGRLSDKATVAAYKPLAPVQPASGSALLGVDSNLQVAWTGGPLPWVNKPEYHYHKLSVDDRDLVRVSGRLQSGGKGAASASSGVYAFDVTCLAEGKTKIELEVGNRPSGTLQRPVVVKSSVEVECGLPDSLSLIPEVPQPTGTVTPCPLAARTGRTRALVYRDLVVKVAAFDARGRKFDNFSADGLRWTMSENGGGGGGNRLKIDKGLEYSGSRHSSLGFKVVEEGFQTLLVGEGRRGGPVDISAAIEKGMLGFGGVKGELKLNLVEDASVDPSSVGVFNHRDSREFVQVRDGSGYFEVANGNPAVAESSYVPSNQTVKVRPVEDGDVVLTVRDLCLTAQKSPTIRVHVSGVEKVELLMSDKVQKAKSVQARVRLLDRHGQQLPASAHKFLQVQVQPATAHVRVTPKDSSGGELLFTVKGSELGETTVVATAAFSGRSASSSAAPIHVFPPLELEPRNVTLIVGAKFQVKTVGGPMPDSAIEFSLANGKVADSNGVGLIEALTLGSTRLTARAVGIDRVSGKKVAFSEDQVDVHVVKLNGVRVETPVRRLKVGGEMPVHAVGLDADNQNAFAFGSAIPNLELEWTSTNNDAAELVSVFHRSGIFPGKDNEGVMRLVAKKPGRVLIKLKARITETLPGHNQFQLEGDRRFEHQLEVHVFEDLRIISPPPPTPASSGLASFLLLAPESEFQLATNRDRGGARSVEYEVMSGIGVSVSKSGLVRSGRSLGSSVILVEATEDFGVVQRTSVVIDVKPVHYMMINVGEAFTPLPGSSLTRLPRGLSLPLYISYHDNTGARFSSDGIGPFSSSIDYRPSRFDSLVISESANETLRAVLAKEEFTVLRTWGGGLQDFVIFNVGKGIAPSALGDVLIGDVIDLDNLVAGAADGSAGRWVAEPSGMAEIDPETGVAVVLRAGAIRFSYFPDGGDRQQRTTLDVGAETPARLALAQVELLTRRRADQFLPFAAVSSSSDGGCAGDACNFRAVAGKKEGEAASDAGEKVAASDLFECHARFLSGENKLEDYFNVEAVFNFKMRSYACRFSPRDALFQSQASLLEDDVELEVSPKYSSRLGAVKSDRVKFRFVSGFHVLTEDVELSNVEPSAKIQIQGLTSVLSSVRLVPSHEEFLSLGREYSESASGSSSSTATTVPLHLSSAYWSQTGEDHYKTVKEASELYVTISSSLTSQSVRVPVRVRFSAEGACAAAAGAGELGWASLFYFLLAHYQALLFMLLACLICVAATKAAMSKSPSAAAAKTGAAATGAASDASSLRPLKGPLLGGSPVAQLGSPLSLSNADHKPYLWTVDNSPVYGSPDVVRQRRSAALSPGSPGRSLTQYSYSDM